MILQGPHQVCLWRLVKGLYDRGQVFSRMPKYGEFRRVIVESTFQSVVFHRMVDIGRCAKCEYYKWKCASVPVELRAIWQDALSKHHLLQIQQKQRYSADRARAASDFPQSELYLAISINKYGASLAHKVGALSHKVGAFRSHTLSEWGTRERETGCWLCSGLRYTPGP
jgi:hypothetical protein